MRRIYYLIPVLIILIACNKEKKLMENLTGNWKIDRSEKKIMYSDGSEEYYEDKSNAGELIIFEDPNNPSEESKKYTFNYVSDDFDTLKLEGTLISDEKNKRLIFKNAFCDSSSFCDLVWTIDKSKKNKQEWFVYGIDSTLFFPDNKFDPGSADNWLNWRITLKKEN